MTMSPSMFTVLALAIVFGGVGSLLMIIGAATDQWEQSSWDIDRIKELDNVMVNESVFNDENQFYKVVVSTKDYTEAFYLRSMYGGIWRICDKTSEKFRADDVVYKESESVAPTTHRHCISYIADFEGMADDLDASGKEMGGMQDSAASCCIVSMMCLVTAAVIGAISIWQRQVSACMITGVMYVVAAVFNCFSLIIIITKLGYMRDDCYAIDKGLYYDSDGDDPIPVERRALCGCRAVSVSWSVPIAWLAFGMFLISAVFWCFMSRFLRLEKTKSMI